MLKHRIPTQVIAAVFCFCIAGISLGICAQVIKNYSYYESVTSEYQDTESLLMMALFGVIAFFSIICALGFLKKKTWAPTSMTIALILALALAIVSMLAMLDSFIRNPIDGIMYLFAAVGLPLVALLFFSSADIFPWAVKEEEDRHHDIIDHF